MFKNVPMSRIADALIARPPYGLNGQRVVDQTGLDGGFDIALSVKDFDLDNRHFVGNLQELDNALFVWFSTALEMQYGLKLERQRLPMETLVIDSGNKIPTDN